jgi:hypothetical protein
MSWGITMLYPNLNDAQMEVKLDWWSHIYPVKSQQPQILTGRNPSPPHHVNNQQRLGILVCHGLMNSWCRLRGIGDESNLLLPCRWYDQRGWVLGPSCFRIRWKLPPRRCWDRCGWVRGPSRFPEEVSLSPPPSPLLELQSPCSSKPMWSSSSKQMSFH